MKLIRFRYRRNSDELNHPVLLVKGAIRSFPQSIPLENDDPSIQILRYRGVSYIREVQQIPLTAASSTTIQKHNSEREILDRASPVQTQQMGFLYPLYCLGWRNASLQQGSSIKHLLLSFSLDYRKGYHAGLEWRKGID
ncbi:hypothetical protein [Leptolyngbya ohadii]|uniref:hypothetical protein n=1 Tax=Leptolyngbya ohadii TaxID=1962290 RepID=UPI000B5A00E7|nr:hypothetical protein [Leptolyngbya ohadii]